MIQPVSADHVVVRRVGGKLVYKFGGDIVPTDEVFHLRAFTISGKDTGLSPIENFAQTMGVNLAAEDFAARFFGDGGHPTAVLESDQPISKEQSETILGRIRAKFMGGSREPMVLGAGTHWKPIQVAPNESQFLDTIRAGDIQIAKIFGLGVCPELVASGISGSNITYANVESRSLDLQTYAIMPWCVRWEQALTPLVPSRPSYVAFDLDARLRVDSSTRWNGYMIGMRAGVLSGQQTNWPPFNVKNEETAVAVEDAMPPVPAGIVPSSRLRIVYDGGRPVAFEREA
jgi:HK97 family phage portal protein